MHPGLGAVVLRHVSLATCSIATRGFAFMAGVQGRESANFSVSRNAAAQALARSRISAGSVRLLEDFP